MRLSYEKKSCFDWGQAETLVVFPAAFSRKMRSASFVVEIEALEGEMVCPKTISLFEYVCDGSRPGRRVPTRFKYVEDTVRGQRSYHRYATNKLRVSPYNAYIVVIQDVEEPGVE